MPTQLKKLSCFPLSLTLLIIAATSAFAAPPHQAMTACEQDYVIRSDDWLSKLADKYFGDVSAYPAIVEATNAAAQADSSYTTITNPDQIEVGWQLCIPSATDAQALMGEEMMGEAMTDEAMTNEQMTGEAMASEQMTGEAMASEQMTGEAMASEDMAGEEMMGEEMTGEAMMGETTSFVVRIENVSDAAPAALTTSFGPGVWVVHTAPDPLFSAGQADRGQGLETLAEDGDPSGLAASVVSQTGVSIGGVFDTPVGATGPGELLPGQAYEFTVEAVPGDKLSLATMFVQSNDLFYAPDGQGIALFNSDGTPVSGDVTGQIQLWDAGTEVNQQPGLGTDQAPRQAGPDSGPAENGGVHIVSDEFTYPDTSATILVSISATESMH